MATELNLRKVSHPERLYIQINDDYDKNPIDPNAFDDETIDKAVNALVLVAKRLIDLKKNAIMKIT